MRSRRPPPATIRGGPLDGAPKGRSTSGLLAVLVVVVCAVGIWLLNGRDPGSGSLVGGDREVIGGSTVGGETLPDGPLGPDGLVVVALAELPPEAVRTVALIDAGGPFPDDADGGTFYNREGLLPSRAAGYYAEYVVPGPGPGATGRRLVVGEAEELYYTPDRFASFAAVER